MVEFIVKTKLILLAATLCLLCAGASAQNRPVFPGPAEPVAIVPAGAPLGFQSIALSGTAVSLNVPLGASFALVEVTGSNASWRDDGQSPTPTIGMTLVAGQPPIAMANLQALKFISTGTSTIEISFYR
jgi:hypothetical protein